SCQVALVKRLPNQGFDQACRLIFNSFAASSSSFSIGDVKSTFTRRIGSILRPELVKNRETSSLRSASRAMASAETAFRCLRVFFIKQFRGSLLPGGCGVLVLLADPTDRHRRRAHHL